MLLFFLSPNPNSVKKCNSLSNAETGSADPNEIILDNNAPYKDLLPLINDNFFFQNTK